MTQEALLAPTSPVVSIAAAPDSAQAVRRCPWCSASLPVSALETCPNCHANLVAGGAGSVPGLTEVGAAVRGRRAAAPRRSRLLSWISGDVDDEPAPSAGAVAAEAIALPDREVRREMLRLQLEAEGITVAPDGSIEPPVDAEAGAPAAQTEPAALESIGKPS